MRTSLALSLVTLLIPLVVAVPVAEHEKRQNAEFDYVIVGKKGGTAGLTLANRLSEDSSITVAVIEAGALYQLTNPLLSSTPAGDVIWAGSSPSDQNLLVDWNFITAPQAGANGRRIKYARGKCLGGSSARNFMIYQRGDRGSYQRWADEVGDDSYTFDNLMPYFKKSVKFTAPNTRLRARNGTAEFVASAFDPSGGPLDVSYANYAGPFSSYMEGGMNSIGIETRPDFNSGELMGAQYCSSTITPSNQKRASSQSTFLEAAKLRPNLKVYAVTRAEKILFNSEKRATGVKLPLGTILSAKREVILSAGAFQSPQLLMVSGIGPASQLSKFNIPVIADRRGVGQNMQDHVFFGPTYRTKVQTFTELANDLLYVGAQFAFDYSMLKRGPLTNPVCDFLAWEKAPRNLISSEAAAALDQFPASWPEIEYLSAPGYIGDFSNLFATQPKDGFQYASILGALVAPLSRGQVTLTSASTAQLPAIDPGWLTDATDQAVAVAAYKRMRQAFATDAMKAGLEDTQEYFPGPGVQTDEQILETVRDTLMTVWHAACTCKMGRTDDPDAVVDSKARVIGVTGLRVVDASSFALLPPGHPQPEILIDDGRPQIDAQIRPFEYYYNPGMKLRPAPVRTESSPAWKPLEDHFWQGNEIMDAVIDLCHRVRLGAVRKMATTAFSSSIESLANPPTEILSLSSQLDSIPAWPTPEESEHGRVVFSNAPWFGSVSSLITAQAEPAASAVGATGHYTSKTTKAQTRRHLEPTHFFARVPRTDGWKRYSGNVPGNRQGAAHALHCTARSASCSRRGVSRATLTELVYLKLLSVASGVAAKLAICIMAPKDCLPGRAGLMQERARVGDSFEECVESLSSELMKKYELKAAFEAHDGHSAGDFRES
ncbi:gmc oxidoreductase [Stemphylium lycopersici]|nr:gmc oxidoreductase [Stemphylium lycopersici]